MITVSIVTYKTNIEELSLCLASLNSPLISKIYIVDNSNEKYIADFCSQYNNVVYIGSKNLGYGAGHNIAIRIAIELGASYHLVMNSDIYFKEDIIRRIADYMEDNKEVGQLIPNTIYPDGKIQYVVRLLPTPVTLIFRRFMPKRFVLKMDERFLMTFWDHKSSLNVPFHMGCFMFFRLSALKEIGLFDERFFMYTEDIDITRRMFRKYKTIFWPNVTIVHAHQQGSYKSFKMLKIHIVNVVKYFNKWGWLFDVERHYWNKEILKELGYFKKNRLIDLLYKVKSFFN